MSVVKRPRGATALQSDQLRLQRMRLPRVRLPQKYVMPGVAVAVFLVLVILLLPLENDSATQGLKVEPGSPSPAQLEQAEEHSASVDPVAEAAVASPPEQPWVEQVVKSGDNLSLIFKRAGYSNRDVHHVVSQSSDGKSLSRIYPGQSIFFKTDSSGDLQGVRHVRSPLETVTYLRTEAGFESAIETRSPTARQSWATGEINSTLFWAGQQAGLSQNMIMEMTNIFGGVIDFVLDPRAGDSFHLVFEELFLDDEKYKDGAIIAASYTNQGKTFNAFRYEDSEGEVSYYNEDGVSMRKAFLLAPVDFTRVSSNFNPRRLHPIYKTRRPHRGTDYAARRGTPVFAAGKGRVIRSSYSKANGNYVFIQHGQNIVTRYLHLDKRKVKVGQRVAQSQVIGTVGSTGAATGPHLHYEFLLNGVHRNPRTIHKKLPKARSLAAAEMPAFRMAIERPSLQLARLQSENTVAANATGSPRKAGPAADATGQ